MRDIKFRGKRIDNGEWVHGHLIEDCYIVGSVVEWTEDYFNTEFWYKVDPKTVGQYTGLKDKNGKEIYEGDVVVGESFITSMQHLWGDEDIKNKSETHIIKYHEASFKLFDYKGNWVAVLNHHVMSKAEKLEVIGNRWSNPELLEEVRESNG